MPKNTYVIFILLLLSAPLKAADSSGLDLVKAVIGRYQKPEAIHSIIKKDVVFGLLEETKTSEGQLTYSKGRLRLEIERPEASLIVMNKDVIWVVTPTSKELGGKTQVLKISSKELSKQSKAPLAVLLSQKKAWDNFKIKKQSEKNGIQTVVLVPVKPDTMGEIVSIEMVFKKTDQDLKSLSYKDELDNETKFTFLKTDFNAAVQDKVFSYKPPKGAEVTEYK